jgi:hypothetical protein
MANLFCDANESEYTQKDCGIDFAGIVAAAFIPDTYDQSPAVDVDDLEDASWWISRTGASPKEAYVVTKTRGEYTAATQTEEDGFGREATQVTGAQHEANIEFEGVEENRDFVEFLNVRKWKVALITNGDKGLYIDVPVTVYGRLNVPRGIDAGAFWMVNLKWRSLSNPVVFDAPAAIFAE